MEILASKKGGAIGYILAFILAFIFFLAFSKFGGWAWLKSLFLGFIPLGYFTSIEYPIPTKTSREVFFV